MKYRVAEISGILPIFHRILETTFRNTSQQKLGEKTSTANRIIPKSVPPLAHCGGSGKFYNIPVVVNPPSQRLEVGTIGRAGTQPFQMFHLFYKARNKKKGAPLHCTFQTANLYLRLLG